MLPKTKHRNMINLLANKLTTLQKKCPLQFPSTPDDVFILLVLSNSWSKAWRHSDYYDFKDSEASYLKSWNQTIFGSPLSPNRLSDGLKLLIISCLATYSSFSIRGVWNTRSFFCSIMCVENFSSTVSYSPNDKWKQVKAIGNRFCWIHFKRVCLLDCARKVLKVSVQEIKREIQWDKVLLKDMGWTETCGERWCTWRAASPLHLSVELIGWALGDKLIVLLCLCMTTALLFWSWSFSALLLVFLSFSFFPPFSCFFFVLIHVWYPFAWLTDQIRFKQMFGWHDLQHSSSVFTLVSFPLVYVAVSFLCCLFTMNPSGFMGEENRRLAFTPESKNNKTITGKRPSRPLHMAERWRTLLWYLLFATLKCS